MTSPTPPVTRFAYHTSAWNPALVVIVPGVALGIGLPGFVLKVILLSMATGAALWVALQLIRVRNAIYLDDEKDKLVIQRSISGRAHHIPFAMLRGAIATRRGNLAVVYLVAPAEPPPLPPPIHDHSLRPPTLSEVADRAGLPRVPQRRLVLTARVDDIQILVSALIGRISDETRVPDSVMLQLARRRRLRDALLVLLLILGTPFYTAMFFRIFGAP